MLLANSLRRSLHIVNETSDGHVEDMMKPRLGCPNTIVLHRRGDHYNGIAPVRWDTKQGKQGLHYNSLIPIQQTHFSTTANITHEQSSPFLCGIPAETASRPNVRICYSKDDLELLCRMIHQEDPN